MVLIVTVGDLHFKKDTPTLTDLVVAKITNEVNRLKPDLVVFLGDILDNHEKIDLLTQNKAIKFIRHIASMKSTTGDFINVIVVIGNHERPNATTFLTEESAFYCLKGQPNIHVADRVLSLNWETTGIKDKMRFVFVPYVPNGRFHEALDTLDEKVMDPNYRPYTIFCHQEFKGAQIGRYKSKEGDEWPEENPLVISGHIHTLQQVQPNLVYAGTPYQLSYSDDTEKGIILAEYVHGQTPSVKFLKLDIRKKRVIKLKPSEVDAFIPPDNCDVQVDIEGTSAEIKALKITGIIPKMRSRGVTISLSTINENNPLNPSNKPFKELLLEMIKEDQDAITVFNQIFAPQQAPRTVIGPEPSNLADLLKSAQTIGITQRTNTAKILETVAASNRMSIPGFQPIPLQMSAMTPTPQPTNSQMPLSGGFTTAASSNSASFFGSFAQTEKAPSTSIHQPMVPPAVAPKTVFPMIPVSQPQPSTTSNPTATSSAAPSLSNLFGMGTTSPAPLQNPTTPSFLRMPGFSMAPSQAAATPTPSVVSSMTQSAVAPASTLPYGNLPFTYPFNSAHSAVLNQGSPSVSSLLSGAQQPPEKVVEKPISNSDLMASLTSSVEQDRNRSDNSLLALLQEAKK